MERRRQEKGGKADEEEGRRVAGREGKIEGGRRRKGWMSMGG